MRGIPEIERRTSETLDCGALVTMEASAASEIEASSILTL